MLKQDCPVPTPPPSESDGEAQGQMDSSEVQSKICSVISVFPASFSFNCILDPAVQSAVVLADTNTFKHASGHYANEEGAQSSMKGPIHGLTRGQSQTTDSHTQSKDPFETVDAITPDISDESSTITQLEAPFDSTCTLVYSIVLPVSLLESAAATVPLISPSVKSISLNFDYQVEAEALFSDMPLETKLDAAVSEPVSLNTDAITLSHFKNEHELVKLEADVLPVSENAELSEPIMPSDNLFGEPDILPEGANALCVEPATVSLDIDFGISLNVETSTTSSVLADEKESIMASDTTPIKHAPDLQAECVAIIGMKSLQEELAPHSLHTENQQHLDTIEENSINQPAFPDLNALSAKPLQALEDPFGFDDDGFDDIDLENSREDTVKTSEHVATRTFPVAPLENPFGEEEDEFDEVDISAAAALKNNEQPTESSQSIKDLEDEFDEVDISAAALKNNLQPAESSQTLTIEDESVKRSPWVTVPIEPLPESHELEVDDEVDISIPLSATAVAAEKDVLVRDDLMTPSAETLEPVSSGDEQRAAVGESNLDPGLKSNVVEFDNERMILMSNAMDFIDSLKQRRPRIKFAESEALFTEAHEGRRKLLGEDAKATKESENGIRNAQVDLLLLSNPQDLESKFLKVSKVFNLGFLEADSLIDKSKALPFLRMLHADILMQDFERNKFTASEMFERSIELLEASVGETHPLTLEALEKAGQIYMGVQFYDEADEKFAPLFKRTAIVYVEESEEAKRVLQLLNTSRMGVMGLAKILPRLAQNGKFDNRMSENE
ncbi:hypothetical protein HDU80_000518 [Chytriomyces hyalinus]|nr:hypothetical protein HDU80_000518 [Chytriomyces hyalinus]